MDLKELLGGSTIPMRKEILGAAIGTSPDTYEELMALTFSKDMPACWRAAWMMDHLAEVEPALPEKYISEFWQQMAEDHPDGVKRSILRMLCRYEIPEEEQGMATDLILDWLVKDSVPVAIQAYSMEIMLKIARYHPELKDEFITILEDQIPYKTGGFLARARHIIKALNKL